MIKSSYELDVLVGGSSVKEYYHKGGYFIEGKKGSTFELRFRNNSNEKVLFVPTIDGLSVMDGKSGSYDSGGYVVNPYSSLRVDGWRRSDDSVAEFFFTRSDMSYSVRKGLGDANLGVIGGAVFKGKKFEWPEQITIIQEIKGEPQIKPFNNPFPPYKVGDFPFDIGNSALFLANSQGQAELSALSCSSTSSKSANNLGTGWGKDKKSEVIEVPFEREPVPCTVFTIYYDNKEGLESRGVVMKTPVYVSPSPFPKESKYCPPPEDGIQGHD